METTNIDLLPYKLFNLIYKSNFKLYSFLYSNYKKFRDRGEIALLHKIIKPGMVVVDVGANIGFYTTLLSRLAGEGGMVHSFEPDNQNYRHLADQCKALKNVRAVRSAVGSKNGEIDLYASDDLNVDHLSYDDHTSRRRTRVPITTLDKYLRNKSVSFIKIDTQGYEYEVLLGMQKTISSATRIIILTEFSAFDLSRAGTNSQDYIRLVKTLRLKMYLLDGFKLKFVNDKPLLKKNSNRTVYYNLLFVKGNQSINF